MKLNSIVLIGPMGAGKSSIGKQLAEAQAWQFYDTDVEIERRTGVDIPWIFDKEGEAGFRQREVQTLKSLVQEHRVVIATGGGAVVTPLGRQVLASCGMVIYLHADVEQQFDRVRNDHRRPLVADQQDPKAVLEKLFDVRSTLYEAVADIKVSTTGKGVTTAVREILLALSEKGCIFA